jgi:hypothetical protein
MIGRKVKTKNTATISKVNNREKNGSKTFPEVAMFRNAGGKNSAIPTIIRINAPKLTPRRNEMCSSLFLFKPSS